MLFDIEPTLNILYYPECNSKEYIEKELNKINKTYNNSIFIFLEIPVIFDYIFSRYGDYCINGLNISSFIQCCNMNFYYLAKLMSKMLYLSNIDIQSIFSQCCMKISPIFTELLCSINKEVCREVSNDGIILDIIMKSLKNYMDSIEENESKYDLIKNKEIEFYNIIKIFTDLNPTTIYFYINRKIKTLSGTFINVSLNSMSIKRQIFLRSKKLELLDEVQVFSEIEKEKLSKIPLKDDFCGICYEKKPNISTYCRNGKKRSVHQFCNHCMSILLLKVMPCPMCRSNICIDDLCLITTDIRKFKSDIVFD
jgi:hypothetical protein